ncbi:MAG TPA: NTP transferase domain-containing protein [Rhizomicrobium sp.]
MNITPEPSDHLRIVAVIQARMGSTRLPGKVLREIAGKPLLWHIVHRLKHSQFIERIAIATSVNPLDDAIVEWGRANAVPVVRGPEDNVLARFARAAELLDADIIVRVSADVPFIDAGFVDHLIEHLIEQNADYVLLEEGAVTAHEGVDPFTRRGLDRLMMDAGDDPAAREHVTGYFKLHPDFAPVARAPAYPPLARQGARLTIDTPDDLAFVEAVHARMAAKAGEASLADLLLLLDREPGLRTLNAHVKQKPIAAGGGLALIRCDGGGHFGYGHVKRMIALARALRDREGIGAIFAVNGSDDALAPIRAAGFDAASVESGGDTLSNMIKARAPDLLLCDLREGLDGADIARLSQQVSLIACIDDGSDRRLACDLAYYPPVPQARLLDWSGSRCAPHIGWEWALLGTTRNPAQLRVHSARPTLLVAMGGSDPQGLTLRAAKALARLDPVFRARFIIGPGMNQPKAVARQIAKLSPGFETLEGADDLAPEYAASDLALCAFGVTAYELAAYGVPAIYLGLTQDHALSASAFEAAGIGISLGVAQTASNEDIAGIVWTLLNDRPTREEMRTAGMSRIDGLGAERIAADIAQALAAKRAPKARSAEVDTGSARDRAII